MHSDFNACTAMPGVLLSAGHISRYSIRGGHCAHRLCQRKRYWGPRMWAVWYRSGRRERDYLNAPARDKILAQKEAAARGIMGISLISKRDLLQNALKSPIFHVFSAALFNFALLLCHLDLNLTAEELALREMSQRLNTRFGRWHTQFFLTMISRILGLDLTVLPLGVEVWLRSSGQRSSPKGKSVNTQFESVWTALKAWEAFMEGDTINLELCNDLKIWT